MISELPRKSNKDNIARRSLSVFSRKGYDCPSPVSTQSLAFAGITLAAPSKLETCVETKSPTKTPSKRWKLHRNSPSKDHHGTILRLVPKETPPPELTPLEIEMATSPNEEILRNIGLSTDQNASPLDAIYFHKSPESVTTSRRHSKRERKNSQGSIIGVWKDGQVAWDEQKRAERSESNNPPLPSTEFVDISSLTGPEQAASREPRPKIQVVIPEPSRNASMPVYMPGLSESSDELQVPHGHQRSNSTNSSDGSVSSEEDSTSGHESNRSSVTSIDSDCESGLRSSVTKPRPWSGEFKSEETPASLIYEETGQTASTDGEENTRMPSLAELVDIVRTPSTRSPHRPHRSISGPAFSGRVHRLRTLQETEEDDALARLPSPTLSEAERSLEAHLSSLGHSQPWQSDGLNRQFTIPRKPAPPPKSAKRLSRVSMIEEPVISISPVKPKRQPPPPPVSNPGTIRRSSSVRSCLSLIQEEEDRLISSDDAEKVIYHILSHSTELDDLFNMAIINDGFYRVFKRHELELMQKVLKRMSPAAWEYRQTYVVSGDDEPDSAAPTPEYTAATFYSSYIRDSRVIGNVKSLMLERCTSIIRRDTEAQLVTHNPHRTSSVDDALWRIWTFCHIFGCRKGREDDMSTQLDWLRGGVIAHQTTASSSVSSSDSWFATSALVSASDHFAKGNPSGLTAEQLYDMTEMWNCLRIISSSIIGQTVQARQFGVFDDPDVPGGDIDGEEITLEEWHNYLLTLGLCPILAISEASESHDAFALAKSASWTSWSPPTQGTTRAHFLRDAVSRQYEERICERFSPDQTRSDEMREIRRRRGSVLAVELKKRKNTGEEFPYSTEEVPMSRANTILDHLSSAGPSPAHERFHNHSPLLSVGQTNGVYESPVYSPGATHPALRSPSHATHPELRCTSTHTPSPSASISLSVPSPSPPAYVPSTQHPFQIAMIASDSSLHSSEKAIFRIVEMGFTHEEAKGALKITDMGDGLRVDRAVEYLLRQS